jgi:hypothetical protein
MPANPIENMLSTNQKRRIEEENKEKLKKMASAEDDQFHQTVFDPTHITYRFGRLVALRPKVVIAVNVLLAVGFGIYFMANFLIVNDIEQLWSPYGSTALKYYEHIAHLYSIQRSPLEVRVLVESSHGDDNVLTVDAFDKLFELDRSETPI